MLGHRLPGAWQVYDHYDYLPEQAKALSAWAARLAALTACTGSEREPMLRSTLVTARNQFWTSTSTG
jgi:hypothetical protein